MKKRPEQEMARSMYMSGKTYNEIVKLLTVSKSTVSKWCGDLVADRHVKITKEKIIKKKRIAKEKPARQYKRKDAQYPYDQYYLYDYIMRKEGIRCVHLVHKTDKSKTSMTYARYLMSVKEGRILPSNIMVAHRDNDVTNDDINNLEMMTRIEKGISIRKATAPKECVICEEIFTPSRGSVETCSKECKNILVSGLISDRAAMNRNQG